MEPQQICVGSDPKKTNKHWECVPSVMPKIHEQMQCNINHLHRGVQISNDKKKVKINL